MSYSQEQAKGKVYDETFKRLLQASAPMTIRFVNAVFGAEHRTDENVTFLYTEQHNDGPTGNMDTMFTIGTGARKVRYHLEAQSTPDDTMTLRMFRYGMRDAIKNAEQDGEELAIRFPKQAVVYVKNVENVPEHLMVTVIFPDDQKVRYGVKTIKQLDYTPEELAEKGMYLLLPYQLTRFCAEAEKLRKTPERFPERRQKLMENYENLLNRLFHTMDEAEQKGLLTAEEARALTVNLREISTYIYKPIEEIYQKGESIMGERIRLSYDDMVDEAEERGLQQGLERGLEQGIDRGKFISVKMLVDDGALSEEAACKVLQVSVDSYRQFQKEEQLKEENKAKQTPEHRKNRSR